MKSLMAKTRSFIIIVLVALISSCQRDEPQSPWEEYSPVLLSQECKDVYVADSGSYWVYQETSTLDIDTVTVHTLENEIDSATFADGSPAGIWESLYVRMKDSDNNDITIWSRATDSIGSSQKVHFWRLNGSSNLRGLVGLMPYVQDENATASGSTAFLVCDTIFDSLQVGPEMHFEVYRFQVDNDPLASNGTSYYYVSPGKGIVRKDLIATSEVWDLIDYQVIQP